MTEPSREPRQPPVQLAARNITLSPGERDELRRDVGRLARYYDRILRCRVLVEASHRYPTGAVVERTVRIRIEVPGEDIIVTRRSHRDHRTAVQLALRAARRQLEEHARRQRGEVKTPVGAAKRLTAARDGRRVDAVTPPGKSRREA